MVRMDGGEASLKAYESADLSEQLVSSRRLLLCMPTNT